ncbi:YggS family pyridoxal phosphate-dependent enzyme [Alkalihalobacillus sp. AL-G]|uniref:YggS family pyridoxal phosphate-dependent enzyme n=1 Tax=Alkalihalobacillus sp. AL-G TaxID=2926399 RepID=UPI00272D739F|nr:YggS family pyridoxal phosphate-dependent enzyme [Alkalihalobacillus sp. AL-G]WLD95079.1 YggS family pyridoxal phosphate-dependent enzyme [Alkalihalobacillus sp. AL-G]
MRIQENLEHIRRNIKDACKMSGRNPDDVTIIAVTKYVSVDTARKAISAGIKHLGENRDEGFLHKKNEISEDAIWHFIGTLQSRKVKDIINEIDYLHALDRISLAKEIQKRATGITKCFVQVNVSGEVSKHGLQPEEVVPFIQKISQYDRIQVVGLMTMAPHIDNENRLRQIFRDLKQLQKEVQALRHIHAPCTELSMGMSNDYSIAVEEGASYIRIGTSLVGKEM